MDDPVRWEGLGTFFYLDVLLLEGKLTQETILRWAKP